MAHAAATVAFNLMRHAAVEAAGVSNAIQAYSVLASQRYRVERSGRGIEFDPNDPLYSHVTNPMKAALALAQIDSSVGAYLVNGLKYAYANFDGLQWPSIPARLRRQR